MTRSLRQKKAQTSSTCFLMTTTCLLLLYFCFTCFLMRFTCLLVATSLAEALLSFTSLLSFTYGDKLTRRFTHDTPHVLPHALLERQGAQEPCGDEREERERRRDPYIRDLIHTRPHAYETSYIRDLMHTRPHTYAPMSQH